MKEINTNYNNLLTEIDVLREQLETAKQNKEKDLSRNTLNYRLRCGIVLFLDIYININGLESIVAFTLIILFARILFKNQKKVRDNIRKLEIEFKYKEEYKNEMYEILCEVRSLVNERKKEEESESLSSNIEYLKVINDELPNVQNQSFDSEISVSNVLFKSTPIRKVLKW